MRFSLALLVLSAPAAVLPELEQSAAQIKAEGILKHIRVLASDDFAGRFPGTAGGKKSVDYLVAQCRELKLKPGHPNGQYVQNVPLWGTRSTGTLTLTAGGKRLALEAGRDYVAWSARPDRQVKIAPAGVIFAGYGVVAPEHGWDDYADVDARGKVVMVLSGDPPVADPRDPGKLDEAMFRGRALTYHGRTGTKLDQAFAQNRQGRRGT